MIMNLLRVHGLGKFAVIFSVCLLAASVSFGAPASAPVTVQVSPFSNYGMVNPNYNGQSLTVGKSYSMTAYAKSGFSFVNWTGSKTNSNTKLTFTATTNGQIFIANFKDKQKPSLAFTSPANNSVLTNPAVIVAGTASDNDMVTKVFCNWISQGSTNPLTVLTGNNLKNWWVNATLTPGTNTFQAYTVDRSTNSSPTNKLTLIYSTAPVALAGNTITVTDQDYYVSFSSGTNRTFSEKTSVGTYNYLKTGPLTGKLSLHYIAPPAASNNDIVVLQFTNATGNGGRFAGVDAQRDDDFTNSFAFSAATNLAQTSLTGGAKIRLTYDGGTNESHLTFLSLPLVSGNSNSIATSNPLIIPLASSYPGEIGDRVQVVFNHQHLISGIWYSNAPMTFIGTIVGIGSGTNTVTVLFDIVAYNTHTDVFSPMINTPLNILTYYYTDYTDGIQVTNGTGTFTYTNYSLIGSLLQLTAAGTNYFYILTYTNQSSSTNDSDIGSFYEEAYVGGNLQGTDSGSFFIAAPPGITRQPGPQTVPLGGIANFSVAATGTQPLTYQWQFNGNNLTDEITGWGSIILGSSTTNLIIDLAAATTTNDIGNYTVVVANGFGTVTSSVAPLVVSVLPVITNQPLNVVVTNGGTARFNVGATGVPPLTYQWQFGGTNLTDGPSVYSSSSSAIIYNSSTPNLTIKPIYTNELGNLGNYRVIISNNYGSVTSSPPATLTFSAGGPPGP